MHRLCTYLVCCLTPTLLAAQPRVLSLDEAIQLGLTNSTSLKLSQIRQQSADLQVKEAREQRLPEVTATGAYLRVNQPQIDLKIRPSGNGDGGGASALKVDQAMYSLVNASIPLFSGFRVRNSIESAKYLKQATQLDATRDREAVVANTISAYSNLFKAYMALDLVHDNLKQARQLVKDFTALEQNGIIARNDLLKAQLQESNIILAQLDAENNLKLTGINMALMLGLDEQTNLVPDSMAFSLDNDNRNYLEWERLALENRQDLQALAFRRQAAGAGVKAAQSAYYPSLALTGGYVAAYVPNLLTLTNALNAGVGIRYSPSSLWKAGTKVAEAKMRVQELSVNQAILNDNIRLEVAQSYQNLRSARQKIEVYRQAMVQADENYRIVNNKYQNALANTSDVLEADVAQLQARLNYAFARADAFVAYKKLQQAAGILSNFHK